MIKLSHRFLSALFWLISAIPLRLLYGLSGFLFLVMNYIVKYRKDVIETNLRNSFPNKNTSEITHIRKQFYRYFCDLLVESMHMSHMSSAEIKKRMRFVNSEIFDKHYSEGRDIIFFCGHYCNWEWLSYGAKTQPHHFMALYKPLRNAFFDWYIKKVRGRFGAELIPMKKTFHAVIANKQANRTICIGFIGDQSAPTENKFWTSFLGQEAAIYTGAEKIAKKLNAPVYFVKMTRPKRGYYDIELLPITENPKDTADFEIAEKQIRILESIIRETPQYWLWSHKRWKHTRPAETPLTIKFPV